MKRKILIIYTLLISIKSLSQNSGSILLDGKDDIVLISNDTIFNVKHELTMEAWVKCDTVQSNLVSFIINKSKNKTGYDLTLNSTGLLMHIYTVNGNNMWVSSKKKIKDNIWHHVAGTFDGEYMKLYVDGIETGNNYIFKQEISSSSTILSIGGLLDTTIKSPFKGNIDEIRIWDVARSANDIFRYKDSCLHGNDSGLIGYWQYNEKIDSFSFDKTKYKNNCKLKNGVLWSSDFEYKELCKTGNIDDFTMESNILIYPNPITELSKLKLKKITLPLIIEIHDSRGKLIKNTLISTPDYSLPYNELIKGFYIISVYDFEQNHYGNFKFIK